MGGGGRSKEMPLEYTPTWVVASVCSVIVVISLALERLIHLLGKVFMPNSQSILLQSHSNFRSQAFESVSFFYAVSEEEEPKASVRSPAESERRYVFLSLSLSLSLSLNSLDSLVHGDGSVTRDFCLQN